MNVEIGTETAQFPEKGIHKLDFRCSVEKKWWSRVDFTRDVLVWKRW
jgi:hypothetical protein